MNKNLALVLGLVVLTVILTREFLPRTVKTPPPPPMIVTVHDTVHDTLRVRVPAKATTDTVQLVIRETIHDTTYINVGADPATRTAIWPVLSLEVGKRVGDTTRVNTFDLKTGRGASASVYTAGPLLGVWADSNATPRLTFGPPPAPPSVSIWTKLKWGGIGYGACTLVNGIADLVRP